MNKIGQCTVNELVGRDPEHARYAELMTKSLMALPQGPKPAVLTHFNGKLIKDLSDEEKEGFYFSMQPLSTKEAMIEQKKRKPSEDFDWLTRPIYKCLANPNAKNRDELVGTRPIDIRDIELHKATRVGKNSLGDSKESSVSEELRERAVHAFTYSKPADLTEEELTRVRKLEILEAVSAIPVEKKKEKLNLYGRFVSWLQSFLGENG